MNAPAVVTTYAVKIFSAGATSEEPFADLAAATAAYEVLEHAYHSDEGSNVSSAYLYAITGEKRIILRTFDRNYDDFIEAADSAEPYKCVYCGQRSHSDDTVGFYCYAGPRGEHHYELVDGDE